MTTIPSGYGEMLLGNRAGGPIRGKTLTDELYEEMWKRLVNLEYSPGTRLSDDALATEFGVSRTPMREALSRLGQAGLVEIKPYRGYFVAERSPEIIDELFGMRIALETYAIRTAIPHIDPADLPKQVDRQPGGDLDTRAADADEFVRTDLAFHTFIVERAGNEHLRRSLIEINGQLSVAVLRLALVPQARRDAIDEHADIVEAITAGDARRAADVMEQHIRSVQARVHDMFAGETDS